MSTLAKYLRGCDQYKNDGYRPGSWMLEAQVLHSYAYTFDPSNN
jgi:hypothetical protein